MLPLRLLLLTAALAAAVTPCFAEGPAAYAPPAIQRDFERSFARFAATWIERERDRSERSRSAPRLRAGVNGPVALYERVADTFHTELRATGRPGSPYVGVIHYSELGYQCADPAATSCEVASETPLSALFRYRDGRWVY